MTPIRTELRGFPTNQANTSRPSGIAAAVAAALGVLAAPHAMAQAASASDLDRLQDQVKDLQSQIDKLKQAQQGQAPQAAGTPAKDSSAKPAPHVAESGAHKFSLESADGQYSIALTGRLHLDVGGYPSFKPDSTAVGTQQLSNGFNARRARIGVTGKVAGDWQYWFIYDAGNSQDSTPAGIQWAQISYVGFKGVQIDLPGYSEPAFTLETAQSSNDLMFLERAVPVNVATNLGTGDFRANTGVAFYSDRYWLGAYLTGPQSGDSHTNVQERFGTFGRATVQVLQSDNYNLHLGVGVFELIKAPNTGPGTPATVTLSDRPELRIDPTALLTTGAIGNAAHPVTGATVIDGEVAAGWGSLFAMGEYFNYKVDRIGLSNNSFDGAYAEVSYTLTGEHRRYVPNRGSYSAINPVHPVGSNGGFGAWEIAARYSYTNLIDQFVPGAALSAQPNAVNGGRLKNATFGVNWYVNSYIRFMFNYIHSELDKANGTAVAGAPLGVPVGYKFDAIALRSQVAW
jgi:phosphate-selective porin OprO/OprP